MFAKLIFLLLYCIIDYSIAQMDAAGDYLQTVANCMTDSECENGPDPETMEI